MPRLRSLLATVALTLVSACATTSSGEMEGRGDAGPMGASVMVNNNLTIPTPLTVYLVPESGNRRLLGEVSPGVSRTLSIGSGLSSGRYRLLGRVTGGRDLVSDPFSVREGEQVRWNLQSNIVTVGTP